MFDDRYIYCIGSLLPAALLIGLALQPWR